MWEGYGLVAMMRKCGMNVNEARLGGELLSLSVRDCRAYILLSARERNGLRFN